jgi:hypothetical protein
MSPLATVSRRPRVVADVGRTNLYGALGLACSAAVGNQYVGGRACEPPRRAGRHGLGPIRGMQGRGSAGANRQEPRFAEIETYLNDNPPPNAELLSASGDTTLFPTLSAGRWIHVARLVPG